jgi:TatD DNase family protein
VAPLFDVHAHLTHPNLLADVEGIVARAEAAGLTTIVSNGLNPADNQAVRELARRFPIIKPAFGLYPVDAVLAEMLAAGETYPGQRDTWPTAEAIAWVREHVADAFAVGEIGLDGYWVKESFWPAQEQAFRELVQIAIDADKAIIIHTRKRERLLLETDSPYLGPEREKQTENEPANVAHTLQYAAELWGTAPGAAAAQFASNFEALFGVAP